MRTNYVLIDYENVQPENLTPLKQEMFKVMVFVGANQTKLTREIVFAMQSMGPQAEYVEITGNGSNALDFHIAYYIGKLSATDPEAYFHIISKDAGFDPMITHLKAKKLLVDRVKTIEEIPLLKVNSPKPVEPEAPPPPVKASTAKATKALTHKERVALISANLKMPKATTPKTVKKLSSHINSMFAKTLAEDEIKRIIQSLEDFGTISIADNKVTYHE